MAGFEHLESKFNLLALREKHMDLLRKLLCMPISHTTKSRTREVVLKGVLALYILWVFLNLTSVFVRANKLFGYREYLIQHKTLDVCWQNRNIADLLFRVHYFRCNEDTETLLKEALKLESLAIENGSISTSQLHIN